ncbi:MAG: ADP-glyceromanno-heptose 6-epimerase [Deferribacteraceae bacterium]|jgi:ADP-L-glycero-D-manno-heptose 6-epimerase|nr:ADP-glyceromanno-heptose 6-epimerase [Deferribacteraceae bacterium]
MEQIILVTGGAGFIGFNLVKKLNDLGCNGILITDDLTDGAKCKNLAKLDFKDYLDYRELFGQWKKLKNYVKVIFHQGACSDTTVMNGRYMMEINYEYSKDLLLRANRGDIPFIYASSAAVYGNGTTGFAEKRECESPLNPYAFSKFQFDRFVQWVLSNGNNTEKIIGLRYFNVYGPGEAHKGKMASVAYHLYKQMKRGETLKLFEGSDSFLRDFIYVDDVVSVIIHMWQNKVPSGIYNCGTGKAESFTDVAEAVRAGYPQTGIEYIPFPEELKGKYQKFTQADLKKLRETAGYSDYFKSVKEGVSEYIKVLDALEYAQGI